MKLKLIVKTIEEVPQEYQKLYEKVGDEWMLQMDDVDYKQKLTEFRNNNITLTQQITTLKDEMKKFENIDPARYAEAQRTLQLLEEKKLIEAGKVDEVVALRVEAMSSEFKNKMTALETRATTAEKEKTTYKSELDRIRIENTITAAIGNVARPRKGAMTDIINRAKQVWSIGDNDALTAKQGDTILYDQDGKAPLTPEGWASLLVRESPFLFEPNAGGASPGSGGNRTPGGVTVVGRSDFSSNLEDVASGRKIVEATVR